MTVMSMLSPARVASLFSLVQRAFGAYRVEFVILTILGFLTGLLEGIGVTTFVPLLNFELTQGAQAVDTISNFIHAIFRFLHIPFLPKFLLLFIVFLFMAKALVGVLSDYVRVRMNADFEQKTREKLFNAQLRSSWSHLLTQRLGHLETIILVDIASCKEMLARTTVSIIFITNIIMYLAVVFSVSWQITLLTILLGGLSFFVFRPIASRIYDLSIARSSAQHDTAHHVTEHLSGMKSVKTFGAEEPAIQRGTNFFATLRMLSIRIDMLRIITVAIVVPAAVLYVAVIFGLAFRFNVVAVAALPTVVYLIYRIFSYVQQLQDSMQLINGAIPYLKNVLDYLDRATGRAEIDTGEKDFTLKEEIRFDNVRFAYDTKEVLKGVSFAVKRGTMVGLIGPSGAGKTTTVDLLLRLLSPRSGAITVDGVASSDISLQEWRTHIAYVPQEPFLLHDTIRSNIAFYDGSITDEDVWEAAKLAHVDEFIRSKDGGLDTLVGERGIQLSAGQRQRITIARALARKPDVLILDEATSALDAETETHIQRMLLELKGKVTIIVIAHRLSTILHSDNLIVIEEGRIVEGGPPQKLLKDTDSYFYKVSTIAS